MVCQHLQQHLEILEAGSPARERAGPLAGMWGPTSKLVNAEAPYPACEALKGLKHGDDEDKGQPVPILHLVWR